MGRADGSRHTITPAKASGYDGDLSLTLLRGPEGTVVYSEVLWAVEDGGVLLVERGGRHEGEGECGRGGMEGEGWVSMDI